MLPHVIDLPVGGVTGQNLPGLVIPSPSEPVQLIDRIAGITAVGRCEKGSLQFIDLSRHIPPSIANHSAA
jgi:hypothetical protein